MSLSRAFLLSDLHLGPGTALTTFREQDALAALLDRLADDPAPAELILAGDTFDFLQCERYDGFNAAKAVARFDEIARGPGTTRVLDALARYGVVPSHEVTVLAGNHDPEVLLRDVQEHFAGRIGRRGSVQFADETLVAGEGEGWPVWGYALGDAAQPVWVAHGDRWDPHNAIHHDELRAKVAKGEAVALPIGSHLVFEVLSQLKPRYGWVDELKPELSAVLPLLLYLDAPGTMRFLAKHRGIGVGLVMGELRGRLRVGDLFGDDDTAATDPDDLAGVLADALAQGVAGLPKGRQEASFSLLERWLEEGASDDGGDAVLASHANPGRWLIRAWLAGVQKTDRFMQVDAADGIEGHARRAAPEHVHTLVAGHTHGPRRRLAERPRYVNSGTWIPVAQVPVGELEGWIDRLDAGETWGAESPRSLVRIETGEGEPRVALMTAEADGTLREVG